MQHFLYMRQVSAKYDNKVRPNLHAKKKGVLNSINCPLYSLY